MFWLSLDLGREHSLVFICVGQAVLRRGLFRLCHPGPADTIEWVINGICCCNAVAWSGTRALPRAKQQHLLLQGVEFGLSHGVGWQHSLLLVCVGQAALDWGLSRLCLGRWPQLPHGFLIEQRRERNCLLHITESIHGCLHAATTMVNAIRTMLVLKRQHCLLYCQSAD